MFEELLELSFGRTWDEQTADQFRREVERADGMGMRPGVFGKAGDSNLGAYNALYGLGCREPIWDSYGHLEPVLRRYRKVDLGPGREIPGQVPAAEDRAPWNSFSRSSEAARSGIIADHLLEPSQRFAGEAGWHPAPDCGPDESALEYEIRLIKPQFVLIHLGTNGSSYGMDAGQTAEQVRDMIARIRQLGPAPVALTIPPQLDEEGHQGRWDFAEATSARIAEIAREEQVPLFDQWQALADERLINNGMISFDGDIYDGFHLETLGGFRAKKALTRSVDFRPEALLYGTNLRNLLFLHVLSELDAAIRTVPAASP
jgi:hypothetical protein